MKRIVAPLVVSFFAATVLAGCIVPSPVAGGLYTNAKGPVTATASTAGFSKVGTATATSILGLIGTGDASIDAAMRNGGITKIHHVDYEAMQFLGLFGKLTVIVYGD